MGEESAAGVSAGVMTQTVAKLADEDKYGGSGKSEQPIDQPKRCGPEIAAERRIDDGNHADEREDHRAPQVAVMQLVTREKAMLGTTLEDIGELR